MLPDCAILSTNNQNLNLQKVALYAAGCERLSTGTASGARAEQPGLIATLNHYLPGDSLVVWNLDSFRRSLPHLWATCAT